MTQIKVPAITASDVMEIVKQVRDIGLVQGKDFDFAYHPGKWDAVSYEQVEDKHVVFKFYEEKWATLFSLKWGSK